ncbi:MAG: hypothetical protein Q9209_007888 [Squamulea sp. 1 TL-2023]
MARGLIRPREDGTRSRGRSQRLGAGLNPAYKDMLGEANSSPTQTSDEGRTNKRRRVRGRIVAQNDNGPSAVKPSPNPLALSTSTYSDHGSKHDATKTELILPLQQQQAVYNDDSSEESDFAWEEVGLPHEEHQSSDGQPEEDDEEQLDLVLIGHGEEDSKSVAAARRKPLTTLERKLRLEVHKIHLLCLLSHVHLRNYWCNDQNIHKALYRRLPKQIASFLNPDQKLPQFRQDESFRDGLKKASDYFRSAFTVNSRGMSRSYWAEDAERNPAQPPLDLDVLKQKADLLDCAKSLEGSRDVGAQLFCALLRSAGVESRLICSLQVLPLIATVKGITPQKPPVRPVPIIDYNPPTSDIESDHHSHTSPRSSPAPSKRPIGSTGGLTRFSNPNAPPATSNPLPRPPSQPKPKRFRESPNPIYWLEVYNPHSNKWTPLDPLVTHTIGKPSALTPAFSDPQNNLIYAIAFNDDHTAKDVTRRYTRAYNAKILKQRIDLSPQGKAWLSSVLALFTYRGRGLSAKDELENTELAKKEASEPMPRNIQDFKNHPVYALERHLHRNEVIHPRHEIGRVSTGTGSKNEGKSEPVFRRKDVLTCRTADQWFRLGKEIREGEQPLKRLFPAASSLKRPRRSPTPNENDDDDGETGVKSLYALHQTKIYVPPAIPPSGAPIPRNAFKNLDVYVPSMVPARGWHSVHPLTSAAARVLGIDYVPAVTGFSFSGGGRGRSRGSATLTGAVVWEGHREALEAVIEGLEDLAKEEEEERWRAVLWGVWRKFIRGLRVRERVKGYQIEGEDADMVEMDNTEDEEEEEEEEEAKETEMDDGGGGFFPEQGAEEAVPTSGMRKPRGRKILLDSESEDEDVYMPSDEEIPWKSTRGLTQTRNSTAKYHAQMNSSINPIQDKTFIDESEARGFDPGDPANGGGFIPKDSGGFVHDETDDAGGGFIPDDEAGGSGGFINNEERASEISHTAANDQNETELDPFFPLNAGVPSEHTITPLKGLGNNSKSASISVMPAFGNLTEEELVEARLLEEFYATEAVDSKLNRNEESESRHEQVNERIREDEEAENKEEMEMDEQEEEEKQEEEDKGSLLSEDPSDAEAEPEWLS